MKQFLSLAIGLTVVVALAVGCMTKSQAPFTSQKADSGKAVEAERKFDMFTRVEQGWITIVTSGEVTPRERKTLHFAILADLPYEASLNGLPKSGELQRVSRIEDKLIEVLRGKGAIYLGHITGGKTMTVVFYSSHGAGSSILVKAGGNKNQKITLESHSDPKWAWFDREMKPSPVEHEISNNEQLLESLKEKGDVATKERQVDFTVYFPSEAQREAFLSEVATKGYTVDDKGRWVTKGEKNPFSCEIHLTTSVVDTVIAEHCAYVRKEATLHGGDFDGWACHITK